MKRILAFFRTNGDVLAVFAAMMAIFTYVLFAFPVSASDFQTHAEAIRDYVTVPDSHMFSGNFLMYFIVNLLTLFSGDMIAIYVAFALVVAAANTAKYVIVRNAFALDIDQRWARMMSAALLVVYIIPVLYFFPGIWPHLHYMHLIYLTPNEWHNSTFICMMPFAIIAYLLSIRQLEQYDPRRTWYIGLSLMLSVLVKPSFFFIYAVVFPIIYWMRYRFSKTFWLMMIPVAAGVCAVLYEYLTIFLFFPSGGTGGVAITAERFAQWPFWQVRLQSWTVSLALPIIFVWLYWKEIRKDYEFYTVAGLLAVALGIFLFCVERGPRASHGNFAWQIYAAMWFVYYYVLKVVVQGVQKNGWQKREIGMVALYGLHVIFGIVYLLRFLIMQTFH